MSVVLSPVNAWTQFFGGNTANSAPNVPLSGGQLNVYAAGTTTPVTTYTSNTGLIANTNPIILDSAGRLPGVEIWWAPGASYKFVLMDFAGNIIPDGTWDNIPGINDVNITLQAQGFVNVIQYGADVTGASDSSTAFTAAGNASSQVIVPGNATYKLNSLPSPANPVTWVISDGVTFTGSATNGTFPLNPGMWFRSGGHLSNQSSPYGSGYQYYHLKVGNDVLNTGGNYFVDAFMIEHYYGNNSSQQAGHNSLEVFSYLTGPTSASNPNRNYCATAFSAFAQGNDGGTGTTLGTGKGAMFAIGGQSVLQNGATNMLECTFMEANVAVQTGASCAYKCGMSVTALPSDAVQGAQYDSMISMSNQSGAIGFRNGIQFGAPNGAFPLVSTGTILNSDSTTPGTYSLSYGIDLVSFTFGAPAIRLPNAAQIAARNIGNTADILLMQLTNANAAYIGANAAAVVVGSNLQPNADNTLTCGVSGGRWSAVWAANGTIQTSDPSLKTDISDLPKSLEIVKSISPKTFKWKDGGKHYEDYQETVLVQATEQIINYVDVVEVIDGKPKKVRKEIVQDIPLHDLVQVLDDKEEPQLVWIDPIKEHDGWVEENGIKVHKTIPAKDGYWAPHMHPVPRMVEKTITKQREICIAGKRTHWGFMAPDVKAAFDAVGMDFGGYVKAEDGTQHLRPDQLIPVLWKAVQELSDEIEQLKKLK